MATLYALETSSFASKFDSTDTHSHVHYPAASGEGNDSNWKE